MFRNFKSVSMLLLLGGISSGVAYAVPARGASGTNIVQQGSVCKGVVKDATGETIIGASIVVEGTKNAAVTNIDGDFELSNVSKGATIVISYLGYQTKKIVWDGQPLNVTLEENSAQKLDEVVVTALGIKKDAKKLGYAVSTISAEDLTRTGGTTLASGLYGNSGVRIQSAPGGGTSSISISVRGLSSITGNTQPLIIMDGVPIHNGSDVNNSDYWGSQRIESNGIVDINPEDIENITILKGAAASALYGSEAANGVVMITTKKGKNGSGTHVDFSANVSFDKVAYMPEIQKEYGPGYDNWAIGSNSDPQALTGFRTTRVDWDGNPITTPNRETYYSWGAKYDPSKTVTYFDGSRHRPTTFL